MQEWRIYLCLKPLPRTYGEVRTEPQLVCRLVKGSNIRIPGLSCQLSVEDHGYRCCLSRQPLSASSQFADESPHLSITMPHVRARTISSTVRWFRIRFARDSVRASRGKNRAEYGSKRSSTTRSRSLADSVSRRT